MYSEMVPLILTLNCCRKQKILEHKKYLNNATKYLHIKTVRYFLLQQCLTKMKQISLTSNKLSDECCWCFKGVKEVGASQTF